MLETYQQVILWVIIFVIITILIFYFLIYYNLVNLPTTVVDMIADKFDSPCNLQFSLEYREEIYVPKDSSVYEKRLAIALLDTCFITSAANCTEILPIPNPPGFTNQLQINGIEPVSGENVMIGYIFWNKETRRAVFSYCGTEKKSLWRADIRYRQVKPDKLNHYEDGMLMHEGFYGIYLAIRDQLWCWWNDNPWVKDLFITGHSLGAAISTICAFDFSQELHKCHHKPYYPVNYFFAGPRIANPKFVEKFDRLLPTSMNVLNVDDLIPALPPAQLFEYTYDTAGKLVPFIDSRGSLASNHIDSYYYNMPDEPECAK